MAIDFSELQRKAKDAFDANAAQTARSSHQSAEAILLKAKLLTQFGHDFLQVGRVATRISTVLRARGTPYTILAETPGLFQQQGIFSKKLVSTPNQTVFSGWLLFAEIKRDDSHEGSLSRVRATALDPNGHILVDGSFSCLNDWDRAEPYAPKGKYATIEDIYQARSTLLRHGHGSKEKYPPIQLLDLDAYATQPAVRDRVTQGLANLSVFHSIDIEGL
jgi:hypothetical protein